MSQNNKIKVLFIGMTPNPGGLETYMMNIFSKLQGKGFIFYFINTSSKPIAYSKYIKSKGGIVYNLPIKSNFIKYLTRFHLAKLFFKNHHDFDIVHINALSLNELFWAKAARKNNVKHIIFQSHNSGIIYNSKLISIFGHLLSFYNKIYLNINGWINTLAASTKCGCFMFGKDIPFKVIPNGINPNIFYPSHKERNVFRKRLHINNGCKVLITTARLNKQKNYPKIINVFKALHNLDGLTRLVIIGSGSELIHIKNMVKVSNLNKYVYFLGSRSKTDIIKLLNIADLMIMPSFFEAVPFSLTEAQSEGIPAIVSLEGLPKEANITNCVSYLSLYDSNYKWAKDSIGILNKYSYNPKLRIAMNKKVAHSSYNLNNSIYKIRRYYKSLLK